MHSLIFWSICLSLPVGSGNFLLEKRLEHKPIAPWGSLLILYSDISFYGFIQLFSLLRESLKKVLLVLITLSDFYQLLWRIIKLKWKQPWCYIMTIAQLSREGKNRIVDWFSEHTLYGCSAKYILFIINTCTGRSPYVIGCQ